MAGKMQKKLPINPVQILAERPGFDNTLFINCEKCGYCGIGTNDFITGYLTVLSHRIQLQACLIERVHCHKVKEYFEREQPELVGKTNGYMYLEKGQAKYHWFNGEYYYYITNIPHITDLESFRTEEKNICFLHRKMNHAEKLDENVNLEQKSEFPAINYEDCIRRDLRHVSKILAGEFGVEHYEPGIPYHADICDATNYTELLFPIYSDNSNSKIIMALLSIGQLAIHDRFSFDANDPFLINARNDYREFSTIKDFMDKNSEAIKSFMYRMTERTKFQRERRLYALQSQWLDDFRNEINNAQSIKSAESCIIRLMEKIVQESDIETCTLFIPIHAILDSGEPVEPIVYVIQEIDSGAVNHKKCTNIRIDYTKISRTIGKIRFEEIRSMGCLEGDGATDVICENAELFYRHDKNDIFAILLKWREKCTLDDTQDTLFLSILDACYAYIMAEIAKTRQHALNTFREELSHDLIQRLGTLDSHINRFLYRIRSVETTPDLPQEVSSFIKAASDYNSDIRRVHELLMLFRRDLASPYLSSVPQMASFLPYSDLLFELRKELNSGRQFRKYGKELFLSDPIRSDPRITADKSMLWRIVSNLLNNAIKHAYQATKVYLKCYYDSANSRYVFDVISFGPCIPADKAESIFERGVRLNDTMEGEGLGLCTARSHAKRMGGDVSLITGTSDDAPVSQYFIPAIIMAEILYKDKEWPQEWGVLKDEMSKLKAYKGQDVNEVAKHLGILNHYEEVLSDNASSFFTKKDINESYVRNYYAKSTYRTVFSVVIPQ